MTATIDKDIMEFLPDFAHGPLTPYRNQATFDWRKMKLAIEDEAAMRYKYEIWDIFMNNELFHTPQKQLTLDELRHLTWKRVNYMRSKNILPLQRVLENPRTITGWNEAFVSYDINTATKLSVAISMFSNTIHILGTGKHADYVTKSHNGEIVGCFALTEIAHGSNTKGMKTTATYDPATTEYILHSADFTAAKCWVGSLGQCATHAIVYAKLITPDKIDQGLHTFVVPLRCTRTLRAFPGVIVGDMGEKIALNGVDNGFVMFNSYRISGDALLNRISDVDDKGNYISKIRDPNKRFGATLGALSGTRVQICGMATNYIQKAVSIALRYAAVRKQFGPENSTEEFSIIEYQQHQFKLLPYLATTFTCRIFSNWFSDIQILFNIDNIAGNNSVADGDAKGMELHALSSGAKAIVSWIARDGVQVCREACGGHGYLSASGIGNIRDENDVICTYEGENSVLIQQTSNWLLAQWRSIEKGEKLIAPYNTANFINNYKSILKSKSIIGSSSEATFPKNILDAYKWLVCTVLKATADKTAELTNQGKDAFTVKNETQTYHAVILSALYVEHAIIDVSHDFALKVEDKSCRDVLMKLVSLFGAWSLEKHMGTLYMGGYFTGNAGQLLRDGIINLCLDLKPECIALVDVIAPPDFVLNSVLGYSDGRVYDHLQNSFYSFPGSMSKPEWWKNGHKAKL